MPVFKSKEVRGVIGGSLVFFLQYKSVGFAYLCVNFHQLGKSVVLLGDYFLSLLDPNYKTGYSLNTGNINFYGQIKDIDASFIKKTNPFTWEDICVAQNIKPDWHTFESDIEGTLKKYFSGIPGLVKQVSSLTNVNISNAWDFFAASLPEGNSQGFTEKTFEEAWPAINSIFDVIQGVITQDFALLEVVELGDTPEIILELKKMNEKMREIKQKEGEGKLFIAEKKVVFGELKKILHRCGDFLQKVDDLNVAKEEQEREAEEERQRQAAKLEVDKQTVAQKKADEFRSEVNTFLEYVEGRKFVLPENYISRIEKRIIKKAKKAYVENDLKLFKAAKDELAEIEEAVRKNHIEEIVKKIVAEALGNSIEEPIRESIKKVVENIIEKMLEISIEKLVKNIIEKTVRKSVKEPERELVADVVKTVIKARVARNLEGMEFIEEAETKLIEETVQKNIEGISRRVIEEIVKNTLEKIKGDDKEIEENARKSVAETVKKYLRETVTKSIEGPIKQRIEAILRNSIEEAERNILEGAERRNIEGMVEKIVDKIIEDTLSRFIGTEINIIEEPEENVFENALKRLMGETTRSVAEIKEVVRKSIKPPLKKLIKEMARKGLEATKKNNIAEKVEKTIKPLIEEKIKEGIKNFSANNQVSSYGSMMPVLAPNLDFLKPQPPHLFVLGNGNAPATSDLQENWSNGVAYELVEQTDSAPDPDDNEHVIKGIEGLFK